MKDVYLFNLRKQPETYKECSQLDCSECGYGGIEDNLSCNHRRKLYHLAFKAGDIHKNQEAIGKIMMMCLAFDYSPESDGEAVLRRIMEITDKELVTHR